MECGRGGRYDRNCRFPQAGRVRVWREFLMEGAGGSSQAGEPALAMGCTKAAAPMQACAVHLRGRTPNGRWCFRSRLWSAVAEGGTTAATAFRRRGGCPYGESYLMEGSGGRSQAGELAPAAGRSKAAAPMQACAVHLRGRTPKMLRIGAGLFERGHVASCQKKHSETSRWSPSLGGVTPFHETSSDLPPSFFLAARSGR